MVASTRSTAAELQALEHVLNEIFGQGKESTFVKALKKQGVADINELLIVDSDILGQEVTIKDRNGDDKQVTLTKLDIKKLDLLKEWYIDQDRQDLATWMSIKKSEFSAWMVQYL